MMTISYTKLLRVKNSGQGLHGKPADGDRFFNKTVIVNGEPCSELPDSSL